MDNEEIDLKKLTLNYIKYLNKYDESLEETFFQIMDLLYQERWEDVWQIIELVSNSDQQISDEVLSVISAGLLEGLLDKQGLLYIDRVKSLVLTNNRFARMLTGVWRSTIETVVWEQIVEMCRKVKDPLDGTYKY